MNLFKVFTFDALAYATSKSFVAVTWIAIISFLTKLLSPEQFGVFWQLYTLVTGFAIIATTGSATALRRYRGQFLRNNQVALYLKTASIVAAFSLLISAMLFVVVFGLSALFSEWGLTPLRVALVIFSFTAASLFLLYNGHLMAVRQTLRYLLANAAQAITFLAAIFFLFSNAALEPVDKILSFLALSYLVTTFGYLEFYIQSRREPTNEPAGAWVKEFMAFGLPLAFMNGALLLGNLGTQLVLTIQSGPEAAGIFAAFSAPLERMVGFAATIAAMALLPILANHWDQNHRAEVLRFMFIIVVLVAIFSGGVSLFIFVFQDIFVSHLIDEKYAEGTKLIPFLCIATIGSSLGGILADIIILQKKTFQMAWIFLAAVIAGLAASYPLSHIYGASGAAMSRIVYGVLVCLLISIAIVYNLRVYKSDSAPMGTD